MSTLRMRIFLVFGLLFVTVLAADLLIERFGLPLVAFEGRSREKQKEAFRSLNLTADLKKDRLLLWIEEREADSKVIAESPVFHSLLSKVEDEYYRNTGAGIAGENLWNEIRKEAAYREIRQHLDIMMNSYRAYERIDFIDLHSGMVLISTREEDQGSSISEDDVSFSGILTSGDGFIYISRHPQNNEIHLHIARLIRRPGKTEESLALLLHVNTSHFLEPLLHTGGGLGTTGEALLVNREARILAPLKFPLRDGSRAVPLEYRITAEPAKLAAQRKEGVIAAEDYRGVQVLAAYRYIEISPDIGWGLVVKRDRAEIFSSYRREELLSLALIAFGFLFVVGSTYALANSLSRPLIQVSNTAKRIQEGDLSARVEVEGTDEVKVLAEAFNTMVQQLKTSTDELQEKNDELESFVYTAAHDLKNPLIGVQGFLNLLNRSLSGKLDQRQKDLLERASVTLQRFERILTDLLEYSQVRAGPLEVGSVVIASLVERIKEEQWEKIKGSGANISLQGDLPEIRINESRAYQIFSNLISNSLKFTRNGVKPEIVIGLTTRPGETVPEKHQLFFVSDNGIGISQEWLDKIFDLFTRVDNTGGEGSGTGLAIVKRIIRQVDGRIWVESTPGSGTTFYFTLPTTG